jgi:hypothetical protein
MLEYLGPDVKAKKPAKTRAWYCVKCGVFVKPDEAWMEDRGPLCHKHGMRLKMKREVNRARRRRPVSRSPVTGGDG